MKISNNQNIAFNKIDKPVEAFLTPPNDPLAGMLMDQLPKDKIEISGKIGDRTFSYTYSLKQNKIKLGGTYDGLPFNASGTFAEEVNIKGKLGENEISSNIKAATQGPLTKGQAGEMSVMEKLDFNPWNGTISIHGAIGEKDLKELIGVSPDGTKIVDEGSIGEWPISRTAVIGSEGFEIRGSIGGLNFEENIKIATE